MLKNITRRIVSFISAAVLAASNMAPVYTIADETMISAVETGNEEMSVIESETTDVTETSSEAATGINDAELTYQSIELHPNGDEAEQTITLDGMMPEGAAAEAVDVSEEHDGIVAYDITITEGENEYQPGEENPILVEINNPVITNSENIELWHIYDDGTREQIIDFSVEEGKISFYATGFSVYEIVEVTSSDNTDLANVNPIGGVDTGWKKVSSISDLAKYNNEANGGLYISYCIKDGTTNGFYMRDNRIQAQQSDGTLINNRYGIEKTKGGTETTSTETTDIDTAITKGAVKYYFEKIPETTNKFYVYCLKSGIKNYLYATSDGGGSLFCDSDSDKKDAFTVTYDSSGNYAGCFRLYIQKGSDSLYWNMVKEAGGNCFGTTKYGATDKGNYLNFWYYVDLNIDEDPFALNNAAPYGLMAYTTGNTLGSGLAADEANNFAKMYGVETRVEGTGSRKTLYVTDNVDVSEWRFIWVTGDQYKMFDTAANKYLTTSSGSLSVTDNEEEAAVFQVIPNSENSTKSQKRIQLKDTNSGKYISLVDNSFALDNTGTDLWFVKKTNLESNQQITYTADRISVSDGEKACDGQEVIIYTRIWNESEERYDFYAIDYDGSLKRCYAYGDKLMWMGDSINTLLWKLSVYTDNEKETGYYDLQNRYSGRYLNPQLPQHNTEVTSIKKPGLLLPGRLYEVTGSGDVNYGEYYTNILSWDFENYSYAALGNSGINNVEANAMAFADDYYFAVINKTQDDSADNLHTVATVDNNDYGISMKLINFNSNSEQNMLLRNTVSSPSWDPNKAYVPTKNLLTSDLKENGYPKATINGRSFAELFNSNNMDTVNHLFIQSVHDSSGYFEYDSCQNYATLLGGENHQRKQYTRTYKDEDGVEHTETGYDFTIYKELGTHDKENKDTLKHGQFFPYNYITPGKYATNNPENVFDISSNSLLDSNPRKYEKLHTIGNSPDYYFGMEVEASFIQTPSGLDAWGHDVIFEFTGDDDFWLYVDGELVLDLGGIHSAVEGKVNFKTGVVKTQKSKSQNPAERYETTTLLDVFTNNFTKRYKAEHNNTAPSQDELNAYLDQFFGKDKNGEYEKIFKDYTEHHMKIFYMERGAGASNLQMHFNLSSVTPGNVQFEKKFTSTEEGDLDQTDLGAIQFPIQIMYQKNDDDDRNWYYLTDKSEENVPSVSYQNSTQTVKYAADYKSPNADKTYENVFFVSPGKPIEIHFPDDAMKYSIIECAVNRDIYNVESESEYTDEDGETHKVHFDENEVIASGNIKDLIMEAAEVKQLPTITLKNTIKPNSIQALNITKKLYSSKIKAEGNELFYSSPDDETREDKTTFNYRLYLSNGTGEELQLASLREYYVLDTKYRVCRWDASSQQFVLYTSDTYPKGITAYQVSSLEPDERVKVTSHTSPYGSISNIPAGYTINVPGLLVGTKFMVMERDYEIPVGYKLIDYYCERGYEITDADGKFRLYVNLEWNDDDNADEQKLIALYKSDNLLYGCAKLCDESASNNRTTTFEFNYKESKSALSNADQYNAYEISVVKANGTSIEAEARHDNHTLVVNNYNWGSGGSVGDKVVLAVYDNNGELIPDQMIELVFPDKQAVFTFDEDETGISQYQVYEVNVTKGNSLTYSMNGGLISSYDIDKKYVIDGVEYNAAANSAGTIKGGVDASVIVNNCRGFGIRANKIWSDSDFTTSHGRIYTAVYLDDTLLNDKVRCIDYPNTTVQYFFDSMAQDKHLSNYGIYEVELINPVVDENGYVRSYDSLRRLEKISADPDDKKLSVDVADRNDTFTFLVKKRWQNSQTGTVTVGIFDGSASEIPIAYKDLTYPETETDFRFDTKYDTGKAASRFLAYEVTEEVVDGATVFHKGARLDTKVIPDMMSQEYTVSYIDGMPYKTNDNVGEENARTDTIRNTRKGGIEINLHEWNNTSSTDRPLEGGSFQLYKEVTGVSGNDKSYLKVERPDGVHYYTLMNTYVSDSTGNITVLYNFDAGKYMLKQTVAPLQHIGMKDTITFDIENDSGNYYLTNWDNPNDEDADDVHPDAEHPSEQRNWAEYDVAPNSGVLTAIIDIYNKTYTFDVKKVKSGTDIALPGACFKLYREVMTVGGYARESHPLPGYENLVSAVGTGIIPKIDNTLAQGTYYLEEVEAPQGYEKMENPVRFSITENGIVVDNAGAFGQLNTVDSLDGSHVTYVISVPNTRSSSTVVPEEYYFDIEKTLLLDKYMHEKGDDEQMFLFKVERFNINDTEMNSIQETFYVSMNCTDYVSADFSIDNSSDGRYRYNSGSHTVTVNYSYDGIDDSYSFPADIRTGKQHICAKQKGIYRITEVTDVSKTDYVFWKGSNKIKNAPEAAQNGDSVVLTVNSTDSVQTACFANCETEYAYLTSQAWAKNSIME